MTKTNCYQNLGLILLVGAIFTIISNDISNEPDYMKSDFGSFIGKLIVSVIPALITLFIGLVIQWFRKPGGRTSNPQTESAFVAYSYTSQIEESKKKTKTWEENFIDKLDTKVKAGWKTIFIITWIVFLLMNLMAIYGNWRMMNSD